MNPYAVRSTIKKLDGFFGRIVEIEDVFSRLNAMQCCSIVGPRRIGKSSLLFHVTHPNVMKAHLVKSEAYLFAFVDFQELTGLNENTFFSAVTEILEKTKGNYPASKKIEHIDLNDYGTMRGFRGLLLLFREIGIKLVLCCDEFEIISSNKRFSVEFFSYLRGLCSNYDLAIVTSSKTGLYELCHQGSIQTSQFWNIFVEILLGLMPKNEAFELIERPFNREGLALRKPEVEEVLQITGNHPFFIQSYCYHLFTLKKRPHSDISYVDQVKNKYLLEANPHYAYAWKHIPEAQKNLLVEFVNADSSRNFSKQDISILRAAAIVSDDVDVKLPLGWVSFIKSDQFISSSLSKMSQDTASRTESKEKNISDYNNQNRMQTLSHDNIVSMKDLPSFRNLLMENFNETELRDLVFELSLDYENIRGETKSDKVRELLLLLTRVGQIQDLLEICSQLRPNTIWRF